MPFSKPSVSCPGYNLGEPTYQKSPLLPFMFIFKSLGKLKFRESGKISFHTQNNLQILWDTEPANDHRGETWSPF